MLQPDSAKPLYEQIKAYILHQIEAGNYLPHSKIPSERKLAELFGVSRMTVKHAIQELVFNERLYTRVGKGTFVSELPITQQLTTLTGFSEDMKSLGKTTSSRVLVAELLKASPKVAQALRLQVGTTIALLRRLRLADEQPIALENSYLNHNYCEGILDQRDYSAASLYDTLQQVYQLRLRNAEQRIRARMATNTEADLLGIQSSVPVLHITRVTFLADGIPIEYAESAYRGDRYVFRARLIHQ